MRGGGEPEERKTVKADSSDQSQGPEEGENILFFLKTPTSISIDKHENSTAGKKCNDKRNQVTCFGCPFRPAIVVAII